MRRNKVIRVIVLFIAIVFVIHQAYSSLYKTITTETARYETVSEGLDITGIVVRRENIVESSSKGVHHFVSGDGERVASGGIIADIYDSESASLTVSEIQTVQNRINDIEEIQNYNNLDAADLDLVNAKVSSSLNEFINGCSAGDFTSAAYNSEALLAVLNRRQMVTGEATDFSSQLERLHDRLDKLNASLPDKIGEVTTDISGYFISSVDGYENVFDCDNLEEITPEFINNLQPQKNSDDAIGKIVSDYRWYIAAKVAINDSLKYKVGDKLKIITSINESHELNVEVCSINISEEGTDAVIIFSCDVMNSSLATIRTGAMKIVSAEYKGLKVSKSALRVLDGQTGVYVVSGMQLKFIPVNVLYSDDSCIICEQTQSDDAVLRLYDEVVVKGKNVYDGKIIG